MQLGQGNVKPEIKPLNRLSVLNDKLFKQDHDATVQMTASFDTAEEYGVIV